MSESTASGGAADFAGQLARVTGSDGDTPTEEITNERIVRLATRVIHGADMAGLTTVRRDGRVQTQAYTDEAVRELDLVQSRHQEGPCFTAGMEHGQVVITVEDMAHERRWPRFAAEAARLGVASMIACSLPVRGGTAALNLHGFHPDAFDPEAVELASILAAYSTLALGQVKLAADLRETAASRQVVGQATGILIERHRLDPDAAFARLVRASQRLNAKLRPIAEQVVRTGLDPEDIGPDDLPSVPR